MPSRKLKLPAGHPISGDHDTGSIPHAKKPKARPPRGWRDKAIIPAKSLPTYTGPYPVATMEIEVPAKNPRFFSHIKRHRRHVLQLETVLITIYYPTTHEDFHLQRHDPRFSRQLWLGSPRLGMATGLAAFGGFGPWAAPVFFPAFWTKLPAYRNAPIASHWAPLADTKAYGTKVKTQGVSRPAGASAHPVFPLVMFSHGLGGTRTMYSSHCGEYASHGFVVCAVEHRDGSGPRTYVNHAKSGPGSVEDLEARGHVDHNSQSRAKGYDIIDYLWPKDNPLDTMPNNEKGVDTELRNAQIDLRLAEMEEAFDIVREIASGNGQLIADRNFRRKGFKASSSHGLKGVNWPKWKGRVHLDAVTACGHSFGAATVVEILRHTDRFPYISQGIIYDIWGAGTLPPEPDAPNHRIRSPLLAINSEAFTYWSSNFELVESLIQEASEAPMSCPAWLMTLRGTVHVSQSDFSLMWPNITSLLLKAVANPQRALDLNINASLEFLSLVLPKHIALVIRTYRFEGLLELDEEALQNIATREKHEPKAKFVAMRLHIDHEWLYRARPGWMRARQRRKNRKTGREPNSSDEVWLHVKPSPECVDAQQKRVENSTRRCSEAAEGNAVPPSQTDDNNSSSKDSPAEEGNGGISRRQSTSMGSSV